MSKFLNNINLESGNDIQFKTTAGANAGKIEQDGNNLVLSNAVGDVLLGDGSSDVYIGDGTNNVDILFEQSGSIKGDGSAVTLTLGGANTTLNLENPNINGAFSIGSTSINNKLTFTTSNGYILFDHEPSGDTSDYEGSTSVPMLKIDVGGTEKTILERVSQQGGLLLGADDSVIIAAGDTRTVLRDNLFEAAENVVFAAEGGFYAYGFPSNDATDWSNRNEFRFRADSATSSENGLYIGDGTNVQFIDINRNLKNIGTIGSAAITSSGKITGTELEGTSLDINGAANIDGLLDVNAGAANTVAIFESTDDKAFIIIKDDNTNTHLISKDGSFSIGESSSDYDNFKVNISSGNTNIAGGVSCSYVSASSSVTTPTIQLQGDLKILNKAQTSYLDLATRDTSDSEVRYNLDYVGHVSLNGELNFTTNGDKYIDVNTIANDNSFNIRHHNPTGNVFQTAFQSAANGATTLYYNGAARFATTTDGIQLYGNGYLDMPDDGRIRMGADYDLEIYHDGSHSYIQDTGSGGLRLSTNEFRVYNATTDELIINASENDAVELYYNNTKRFETTSTGVSIIGGATLSSTVTATSLIKSGGSSEEFLKADGSVDSNTYATQSYVSTQVSNLVDSAPSTLDTLNELANALGDDASFSTTMSTSLGNRLRVDTASQSLSSTEKSNARTNLGLGSAATSASSAFAPAAGSTSLTTVGTIGTGTWQGSVIASAYLDSDTAHLSGAQTFSGAKTFGNITSSAGYKADITESSEADNITSNNIKYGYLTSAASNKPVTGNSQYASVGNITLTHYDAAAIDDFYIRAKAYNGNTSWAKIFTDQNSAFAPLASPQFTGNVGIGTTNPSSKLHVAGTASIDTLEYSSVVSVFGQSRIKLNELSDVFYKADLRFTVTGGSPSFFNGDFDQAGNLPTNTTNVINVNVAGQQGVPSNGITYPQGNVYISFYYTNHAYTAISLRHKSGGVYYSSTGTDVSTNSGYKVIKFPISTNNYLTDIEISITTDANLVKVAAINYLSDRWTTQLELPFVSKYLTSNTVFGEFGISGVSASSGPHLRLEGTYTTWELENQYTGGATNDMFRIRNTASSSDALVINRLTNNVGIGTTSPNFKLEVVGDSTSGILAVRNAANARDTFRSENAAGTRTFNIGNDASGHGVILIRNSGGTTTNYITGSGNSYFNGGNVGIGTVSPYSKLHVVGDTPIIQIRETSGSAEAGISINHAVSGNHVNFFIGTLDGNARKLTIGGTITDGHSTNTAQAAASLMLIDEQTGNVGIGTTSPTFGKLEVYGNGANTTIAVHEDAGTHEARLHLRRGGNDWEIINNSDLAFEIEGSEIARFKTNGNFGIGTTNPAGKLEIKASTNAGTIKFKQPDGSAPFVSATAGTAMVFQTYTGTDKAAIYVDNSGNFTIGGADIHLDGVVSGDRFKVLNGGALTSPSIQLDDTTGDESGLYLPATNNIGIITDRLERVRIDESGNVGIGTTNPSSLLSVVDSGGTGLEFIPQDTNNRNIIFSYKRSASTYKQLDVVASDFKFTTNGADTRMVILNGGNVGIGTTSPTATLDIKGDGAEIYLKSADYSVARIIPRGTGSNLDKGLLSLFDAGTEDVRIDTAGNSWFNGGNVGIGTTSPDHKLHVKGDVTIDNESSSEPSMLHFNATNKTNHDPTARINFWEGNAHGDTYTDSHAFIEYNGGTTGGADGYLAIGGKTDVANTDVMVINRLGRVGVGTTSPSTIFQIDDNNTTGVGLLVTGGGVGGPLATFTRDVGGSGSIVINSSDSRPQIKLASSADTFALGVNGSTFEIADNDKLGTDARLSINSSGEVGIGTTSPSTKLDVDGITTSDAFRTNTNNIDYNVISRNSTSTTLWVQAAQSGSLQGIASFRYGSSSVNAGTEVCAIRRNSSYFINTKLGIGRDDPGKTLDVSGEVRVSNGDLEVVGSSEGIILTAPSGGRYRISVNDSGELQASAV